MSTSIEWREFVYDKFNLNLNPNIITNLSFIKPELKIYSHRDFEYFFRKIFQQTYQLVDNHGHIIWNDNLLSGSVMWLQDTSRDYWEEVFLKIRRCINYDIRNL